MSNLRQTANLSILDLIEKLKFKEANDLLNSGSYKGSITIMDAVWELQNGVSDDLVAIFASSRSNAMIAIHYLMRYDQELYWKIAYFLAYRFPELVYYVYELIRNIDNTFVAFINYLQEKPLILIRLLTMVLDDILSLFTNQNRAKRTDERIRITLISLTFNKILNIASSFSLNQPDIREELKKMIRRIAMLWSYIVDDNEYKKMPISKTLKGLLLKFSLLLDNKAISAITRNMISIQRYTIKHINHERLLLLKQLIRNRLDLAKFLDFKNNPVLLEALFDLSNVDSSFLKNAIRNLCNRILYIEKTITKRVPYYDDYHGLNYRQFKRKIRGIYAPEISLVTKLKFEDAVEILDCILKKLKRISPKEYICPSIIIEHCKESQEIIESIVNNMLSAYKYDNRLTRFLISIASKTRSIPDGIDKYFELLKEPKSALEFSKLIRFHNDEIIDNIIIKGLISMGRENIFSDKRILDSVCEFLVNLSKYNFKLFISTIAGVFDLKVSNVNSMTNFLIRINPVIRELLLFRYPDVDLESKALEHFFICMKNSPETIGSCLLTNLAKTIEILISNVDPVHFNIGKSDIWKLRNSKYKIIKGLAELFLRRVIEEVSGRKIIVTGTKVSLKNIKNTWIWCEYINKEVMSLNEWSSKKKELEKIGVILEEIKL